MYFSKPFSGLLALSGAAMLSACATVEVPPETSQQLCEDPRPQICTTIYAPVCAVHKDGQLQTHSSACNACADDTVQSYEVGSCDGNPIL